MSLESALEFARRLREDPDFRWNLGGMADKYERRRFIAGLGYNFTPAELQCAASPGGDRSPARVRMIEKALELHGDNPDAFI